MVVDVGTGDGRAVFRRARRESQTLVIGIDSAADSMRETSRLAARSERKGGAPNAVFLVESAESLPGPLAGNADLVTVTLPWGSLLRGVVNAEASIVDGLAGLLRPGGRLMLLLSIGAAERALGLPELDARLAEGICFRLSAGGLAPVLCRPASESEVAELDSSWAKRLGVPRDREAWLLAFELPTTSKEPIRGSAASDRHIRAVTVPP